MTIKSPSTLHVPSLRALFAKSFGESESFLDLFFLHAFSPEKARIVCEGDDVLASLYWFDCEQQGARVAYIYGVSTDAEHRRRGLCRALMENTREHLEKLGFSSIIIVPAEPSLFDFYSRLGFRRACGIEEADIFSSNTPIPLRKISVEEYSVIRRSYLPQNAVIENASILSLLSADASFYIGEGVILAAREIHGGLFVLEFLGNVAKAPDTVAALGYKKARLRTIGSSRSFAMYLPLSDTACAPTYFGFALDV